MTQQTKPANGNQSPVRKAQGALEGGARRVAQAISSKPKAKEQASKAPEAKDTAGVDLTATTFMKNVEGTTRSFYANFMPSGVYKEAYADDPDEIYEGSYTTTGGKLVIETESDVKYKSEFDLKPNKFGAMNGVEQPGGTKMVLQPLGHKIEF